MKRYRGRLLFAAVPVLALAAALALASGKDEGKALLPDLEQQPPGAIEVTKRPGKGPPGFRLGFISAVENVGRGPLEIDAGRANREAAEMEADQLVKLEKGMRRREAVASLRYVESADHSHWHFLGFERYELRRARDFKRVRRDRKTGFCLGDRYQSQPGRRLPGQPSKEVWTQECAKYAPDRLAVTQGMSVGYGDDYAATLEGQFVDVTGLPAGRYQLVHRVNPERTLEEGDYSNNAAAALIVLSWPDGRRRAPAVRIAAVCNRQRCRA